ncbi:unnamed protein product [Scytosiphon promiscuus]
MMQRAFATGATAVVPRRITWSRTVVAAACQKRPLPQTQQQGTPETPRMQASPTAAAAATGVPLPTALRRSAMDGSLRQQGCHFFSTNSSSAALPSESLSPEGEEQQEPPSSSSSASEESSLSTPPSSPSTSASYTVVKHPPTPGWEFPPVPAGCAPTFAVIRLGNTQHKVTKDDVIVAEKVVGDIGTTLEISEVLLVGTRDSTMVGRPTVPGAVVKLFVEEQTRDKKIIVLKKRRRKSSKTTQGHRREVTLLRVVEISS